MVWVLVNEIKIWDWNPFRLQFTYNSTASHKGYRAIEKNNWTNRYEDRPKIAASIIDFRSVSQLFSIESLSMSIVLYLVGRIFCVCVCFIQLIHYSVYGGNHTHTYTMLSLMFCQRPGIWAQLSVQDNRSANFFFLFFRWSLVCTRAFIYRCERQQSTTFYCEINVISVQRIWSIFDVAYVCAFSGFVRDSAHRILLFYPSILKAFLSKYAEVYSIAAKTIWSEF